MHEPRLLPTVRLSEPGGRELLLALRRALVPPSPDETTMSLDPDEIPDADVADLGGPALVVRSGGGRAGEAFVPAASAP